ncbi:Iron-sulfur assembly protein IscA, chloroplastic [Dendrobium catenatum]|uniref:Iron-sulfur assembly protein IscA, chloroplastic n=1 Tax=Dendrobium catenatum TaxID=906689 RepID=A0A2I0V821_9ASPA|nr:Iron-sulfur assembly protein IscA, chloroplastic [Dendrobium catenatum]
MTVDYLTVLGMLRRAIKRVGPAAFVAGKYYSSSAKERREATPTSGSIAPAISLSDKAFNHLNKMRVDKNEDLRLRIGVKQGGCSGMSYTMEFENRAIQDPRTRL